MAAVALKHQTPAAEKQVSARRAPRPELVTEDALHVAAPSPASLLQAKLENALNMAPEPVVEQWSPRRALATMIGVSLILWAGIGVGVTLVLSQLF